MELTSQIFNDGKCSICLETYEKTQVNKCLLLKCGHIFHESCLKEWINQQHNCPTCRSKVFMPIDISSVEFEDKEVTLEIRKADKIWKRIGLPLSIFWIYNWAVGTYEANTCPLESESLEYIMNGLGGLSIFYLSIRIFANFFLGFLNQQDYASERIDYIPDEI